MSRVEVISQLSEYRVVPVVRTANAAQAATAVEWLAEAGFRSFEITLTIPGAVDLIAHLSSSKKYLIGAGTVLTKQDAQACISAGAKFIVSPCVLPEVALTCQKAKVACALGALTPTEVYQAMSCEADAVKIFPVSSVGGADHVKGLKAIFPGTIFVPTGGIPIDGVMPYIHAGAAFVGLGGKLVDQAAIAAGQKNKIIDCGRAVLDAIKN